MKGLSKQEVEKSRQKYGDNIIHEAEPETFFDKLKGSLDDPMIKLLIAIAVIMIVLSFFGGAEITEIIGIVLSIAIVSIVTEYVPSSKSTELPGKYFNSWEPS